VANVRSAFCGITTTLSAPLNNNALPNLPSILTGEFIKSPLWLLPVASSAISPSTSSNFKCAINSGSVGGTGGVGIASKLAVILLLPSIVILTGFSLPIRSPDHDTNL